MRNFPLTTKDSVISDHIYALAIPLLQGGMKCYRDPAVKVPKNPLPADISLHHKDIELCIDFYINEMPFLHKQFPNTTFLTEENYSSRSADNIIQ